MSEQTNCINMSAVQCKHVNLTHKAIQLNPQVVDSYSMIHRGTTISLSLSIETVYSFLAKQITTLPCTLLHHRTLTPPPPLLPAQGLLNNLINMLMALLLLTIHMLIDIQRTPRSTFLHINFFLPNTSWNRCRKRGICTMASGESNGGRWCG